MTLEIWLILYVAVGAVTAAVVTWGAREVDAVSSEGSELILAIPALLVWPLFWAWVVAVLVVLMYKNRTAGDDDTTI